MSAVKRKAGASVGNDSKKPKADGNIASFFSAAPKPAGGAASASASAPAAKFDKAKWVASLKPEQKELLQLEIDTLDESWLAHLKDELVSKEFLDLKRFLDREITSGRKVFPPRDDIYSW
jgi:uracil-DNA glycosylase